MTNSINTALKFLRDRNTKISDEIITQIASATKSSYRVVAIKAGMLHSREIKQADDYGSVRDEFWISVYDAVFDYLNGTGYITTYREPLSVSMAQAYLDTADIAYQDGGASLPLDDETLSYAKGEMNAQLGYLDSLFERLKEFRKEENIDTNIEAANVADRWSYSLDSFYNSIKTMAAGNKMLTFDGDDGKESCNSCSMLKGQRHRASWWISHGYVPPKGSGLDCANGGHCQHGLFDDNGDEWTI